MSQLNINNGKYYGRVAIIGLILAGVRATLQIELPIIIGSLVDILILVGIVSGIIWLVKSYRKHSIEYDKERDTWWKRLGSGKMDMADWLEFDGHITPEANKEIKEKEKQRKSEGGAPK